MMDFKPPENREDLQRIVADAIRRSITYIDYDHSLAAADTVLRALKAHQVTIHRKSKGRL